MRASATTGAQRSAAIVALALLSSACSVIVSGGDDDPIRCVAPAAGQRDPCQAIGPEWRCRNEICRYGCEPELCNGVDDDCDGRTDEGLDDDGDGFSWCRTAPTPLDCDDANPAVHPAGDGVAAPLEVCDGVDNDCDPTTTDGATCPSDTICDLLACTGAGCRPEDRCVAVHCGNRPSICASDQFCDLSSSPPACRPLVMSCLDPAFPCTAPERCNPDNGTCVTARPNGSPCSYDAECASTTCFPADALRIVPEDLEGMGGLCSRACCGDDDCAFDEVCWDSGSGARACVPIALLDRGPRGAPFTTACTDTSPCFFDEVCGLDLDSAYRLDNRFSLSCQFPIVEWVSCSSDQDCVDAFDDGATFCDDGVCRFTQCSLNRECPTGICIGRCVEPCSTVATCPDSGSPAAAVCSYAFVESEGRMDVFPVCQYLDRPAPIENGQPCTSHSQCRDLTCVDARGRSDPPEGTAKTCAATCCSDTHCGGTGQCRPIFVSGSWEMHCLLRVTFGPSGPSAR